MFLKSTELSHAIHLFFTNLVKVNISRVEKRVLLETTNLHNSLVMVAAGIMPKMPAAQQIFTVGERLQQQHLSLDIIEWLIDNWVYTSAQ